MIAREDTPPSQVGVQLVWLIAHSVSRVIAFESWKLSANSAKAASGVNVVPPPKLDETPATCALCSFSSAARVPVTCSSDAKAVTTCTIGSAGSTLAHSTICQTIERALSAANVMVTAPAEGESPIALNTWRLRPDLAVLSVASFVQVPAVPDRDWV